MSGDAIAPEAPIDMVDLAFPVSASRLPPGYRLALGRALVSRLPWLGSPAGGGVHPLKTVASTTGEALLPRRARLLLRLPRAQTAEATALAGRPLGPDCGDARLGEPVLRELTPHTTLYAHFVDAEGDDEVSFVARCLQQLQALAVRAEPICGRVQRIAGPQGDLTGYSLMLHGLSRTDSLRMQADGLGPWRWLGCGLFVPHKSAAAVGG